MRIKLSMLFLALCSTMQERYLRNLTQVDAIYIVGIMWWFALYHFSKLLYIAHSNKISSFFPGNCNFLCSEWVFTCRSKFCIAIVYVVISSFYFNWVISMHASQTVIWLDNCRQNVNSQGVNIVYNVWLSISEPALGGASNVYPLLLPIFHPLLLFNPFLASFSFYARLIIFNHSSCPWISFLTLCSYFLCYVLLFRFLFCWNPCSRIFARLLSAPSPILGLSPCSFMPNTWNRASSLHQDYP